MYDAGEQIPGSQVGMGANNNMPSNKIKGIKNAPPLSTRGHLKNDTMPYKASGTSDNFFGAADQNSQFYSPPGNIRHIPIQDHHFGFFQMNPNNLDSEFFMNDTLTQLKENQLIKSSMKALVKQKKINSQDRTTELIKEMYNNGTKPNLSEKYQMTIKEEVLNGNTSSGPAAANVQMAFQFNEGIQISAAAEKAAALAEQVAINQSKLQPIQQQRTSVSHSSFQNIKFRDSINKGQIEDTGKKDSNISLFGAPLIQKQKINNKVDDDDAKSQHSKKNKIEDINFASGNSLKSIEINEISIQNPNSKNQVDSANTIISDKFINGRKLSNKSISRKNSASSISSQIGINKDQIMPNTKDNDTFQENIDQMITNNNQAYKQKPLIKKESFQQSQSSHNSLQQLLEDPNIQPKTDEFVKQNKRNQSFPSIEINQLLNNQQLSQKIDLQSPKMGFEHQMANLIEHDGNELREEKLQQQEGDNLLSSFNKASFQTMNLSDNGLRSENEGTNTQSDFQNKYKYSSQDPQGSFDNIINTPLNQDNKLPVSNKHIDSQQPSPYNNSSQDKELVDQNVNVIKKSEQENIKKIANQDIDGESNQQQENQQFEQDILIDNSQKLIGENMLEPLYFRSNFEILEKQAKTNNENENNFNEINDSNQNKSMNMDQEEKNSNKIIDGEFQKPKLETQSSILSKSSSSKNIFMSNRLIQKNSTSDISDGVVSIKLVDTNKNIHTENDLDMLKQKQTQARTSLDQQHIFPQTVNELGHYEPYNPSTNLILSENLVQNESPHNNNQEEQTTPRADSRLKQSSINLFKSKRNLLNLNQEAQGSVKHILISSQLNNSRFRQNENGGLTIIRSDEQLKENIHTNTQDLIQQEKESYFNYDDNSHHDVHSRNNSIKGAAAFSSKIGLKGTNKLSHIKQLLTINLTQKSQVPMTKNQQNLFLKINHFFKSQYAQIDTTSQGDRFQRHSAKQNTIGENNQNNNSHPQTENNQNGQNSIQLNGINDISPQERQNQQQQVASPSGMNPDSVEPKLFEMPSESLSKMLSQLDSKPIYLNNSLKPTQGSMSVKNMKLVINVISPIDQQEQEETINDASQTKKSKLQSNKEIKINHVPIETFEYPISTEQLSVSPQHNDNVKIFNFETREPQNFNAAFEEFKAGEICKNQSPKNVIIENLVQIESPGKIIGYLEKSRENQKIERFDDLISINSMDLQKLSTQLTLDDLTDQKNWKFVRNYLVNFLDRAIDKRFYGRIMPLMSQLEIENNQQISRNQDNNAANMSNQAAGFPFLSNQQFYTEKDLYQQSRSRSSSSAQFQIEQVKQTQLHNVYDLMNGEEDLDSNSQYINYDSINYMGLGNNSKNYQLNTIYHMKPFFEPYNLQEEPLILNKFLTEGVGKPVDKHLAAEEKSNEKVIKEQRRPEEEILGGFSSVIREESQKEDDDQDETIINEADLEDEFSDLQVFNQDEQIFEMMDDADLRLNKGQILEMITSKEERDKKINLFDQINELILPLISGLDQQLQVELLSNQKNILPNNIMNAQQINLQKKFQKIDKLISTIDQKSSTLSINQISQNYINLLQGCYEDGIELDLDRDFIETVIENEGNQNNQEIPHHHYHHHQNIHDENRQGRENRFQRGGTAPPSEQYNNNGSKENQQSSHNNDDREESQQNNQNSSLERGPTGTNSDNLFFSRENSKSNPLEIKMDSIQMKESTQSKMLSNKSKTEKNLLSLVKNNSFNNNTNNNGSEDPRQSLKSDYPSTQPSNNPMKMYGSMNSHSSLNRTDSVGHPENLSTDRVRSDSHFSNNHQQNKKKHDSQQKEQDFQYGIEKRKADQLLTKQTNSVECSMDRYSLLMRTHLINLKQKQSMSPRSQIFHAIQNQFINEIEEIFLSHHNLNVQQTDRYGNTYLIVAAQSGNLETIQVLLSKGAQINTANNNGDTPLHIALSWGFDQIADVLINSGANQNTLNKQGKSPWDLSKR